MPLRGERRRPLRDAGEPGTVVSRAMGRGLKTYLDITNRAANKIEQAFPASDVRKPMKPSPKRRRR